MSPVSKGLFELTYDYLCFSSAHVVVVIECPANFSVQIKSHPSCLSSLFPHYNASIGKLRIIVATVVVFRNTCTVIIAIIDYFCFGNKFSKLQMASLALTTVGMLVYAGQDINFNAVGYLWLVGNSFATIANTFWNKVFITKYTKELKVQTSYGVSLIQQIETLPIIFVCAAFNNEGGAYMAYTPLPLEAKLTILATCAGGVLIGIAYPKCFSLLSGTSVVVASTANKAVSILIGMYLFGTRLSGIQVLGLAICISGSLWYALEGKRK